MKKWEESQVDEKRKKEDCEAIVPGCRIEDGQHHLHDCFQGINENLVKKVHEWINDRKEFDPFLGKTRPTVISWRRSFRRGIHKRKAFARINLEGSTLHSSTE